VPLFTSPWKPGVKGDEVTLVQNCTNGPHVLELRPRTTGGKLGFSHFAVYRPAQKEK